MVTVSSVRSAAARIGREAFFEPEILIVPLRGVPPRTRRESMKLEDGSY